MSELPGAARLAAGIRNREFSAVEVFADHLARIARLNPGLNAVVTLDPDGARRRADQADMAIARGEVWGPLHGVPFTLDDAHATAGMRTTVGAFADQVPAADGTVARRLKAAGGILLGKTNVPPMLADYQTANPIFGRTNHPHDPALTPGGASGGAAAAVAARLTPFDVGTDLSGSIRIPAAFCGVYGFKPTERRVSLDGVVPLPGDPPRAVRAMSCVGPLARTAEDLILLDGILAGPDGRDLEVVPATPPAPGAVALGGLRVAVAPAFAGVPTARAIRARVEALGARFEALGATVDRPAPPAADGEGAAALIGLMLGDGGAPMRDYLAALARRDAATRTWDAFFARWDLLLCPAAPVEAFTHREPGAALDVDGEAIPYGAVGACAAPFNYTGHPALVLPSGVQLVARRFDDARLLAVAAAL